MKGVEIKCQLKASKCRTYNLFTPSRTGLEIYSGSFSALFFEILFLFIISFIYMKKRELSVYFIIL